MGFNSDDEQNFYNYRSQERRLHWSTLKTLRMSIWGQLLRASARLNVVKHWSSYGLAIEHKVLAGN